MTAAPTAIVSQASRFGNQMLHIWDGHADEGNAGCDPETVLSPGMTYHIQVMMPRIGLQIMINNAIEPTCSQARTSRSLWTPHTVCGRPVV